MATDTSSVGGSSTSSPIVDKSKLKPVSDAFTDLKIEDFIKLMVTELQEPRSVEPDRQQSDSAANESDAKHQFDAKA